MSRTSSNGLVVDVSVRTWARETHNLFDFEAKTSTITEQSFIARDSFTCVRSENDVEVLSHSEPPQSSGSDCQKLIQIEWRHDKIYLQRPRWGTVDDRRIQRCWELVRDVDGRADAGHRLCEQDIIKFGRSQFRVRQLSMNGEAVILEDSSGATCKVNPDEFDSLADTACRICLHEGSSLEDPLLAPCECRGSIRHVHHGCLKHWVRDRLGLSNGDAAFVVGGATSPMKCELCKTAYQTRIQMGLETLRLVDVDSPFIVLESCNDLRLHVLPVVQGKPVRIGRGHECDMNIHDTSISRLQASVELVDGSFVLKDTGSRFGTYVKITKVLLLNTGRPVSIQVGRTILQISPRPADSQLVQPLGQPAESGEPVSTSPEESLQGDDAPDMDITESPRGKSRSAESMASMAGRSSPSPEEFLSCERC